MNYTNLNIKSNTRTFTYIVEYFDDPTINPDAVTYYSNGTDLFFYNDKASNLMYEKNYWNDIKKSQTHESPVIPSTHNISSFNLYFPRYSVETYDNNVHYALTINTWINNTCIYLGSFLINRSDALAPSEGVKKFLNNEYYEYVRVETVDPFYLIYDDEWKLFRQYYCRELVYDDGTQHNNSASNINITLTPVKKVDGMWIKLDGYDTSQSVIVIDNTKDSNYMCPKLSFDITDGVPQFGCKMVFNEVYEDDFAEYLLETYQITVDESFTLKYCFVIRDADNAYKYCEHVFDTAENETSFSLPEFVFGAWSDYIDGLSANVYVIVQKDGEDVLALNSNSIPITQDIFKYLMPQDLRKVNLNELDMQINNYDIVNVIKNEIVTVERPNEYKSNIIKPVFVKVQEAAQIRVHPAVNENIVIPLDAYKNKVKTFVLKIADTNYYEIGRMNSGIVFKIIGSSLPETDGIYYILNEDGELVTTGNYTIAS